ncbi:MAG: hypothetical protein WCO98_02055 [bacterium]
MIFKFQRLILFATILLSLCIASMSADNAGQKLVIKDWTGRGFAPDAVTYSIDASKAKKLRLFDAAGKPVAVQVTKIDRKKAEFTFVTDLPANGIREFTIKDDGKGETPAAAVTANKDGDALVLATGTLAVKVPIEQEKKFKTPVAANTLPAPMLAFRGSDGAWRGSGKMLATRLVKAFRVSLIGEGPVFAAIRYEIDFAAGGFYHAVIRVEDNVPVVKISEEYDPGVMDGTDSWELNMTDGWSPDKMEVASTAGNGQVDGGHIDPLEKLKSKPSWYLIPDSAWGPLSQLGLFQDSARILNPKNYPMAGIVPLHKGDWRHMNAIEIQSTGTNDVRARFPMSRRNASWLREVTSETSPFSMQEHEPGQSLTYGRRQWGLVLAKPAMECRGETNQYVGPFYQARLFYGVVGLNRYKDYQLDWTDSGVKYPRLYLKAENIEKYKKDLQASALPDTFKQKLLTGVVSLGAKDDVAQARLKMVRRNLASICNNVMVSPTTGHHWTAPNYITASATDDVLGIANMPADVRAEIRSHLALICYLWEEGDIISYGDGSHSGNPNMGLARFSPMVSFLPLVPDHPMFEKWRTHMAQYLEYKAVSQTAPGGGFFEFGAAYHMHGYSRVMNVLPALQTAGATISKHQLDADRQDWSYYMNLLTPVDSRWKFRVFPGLANSGPGYSESLLEAAGELAPRNSDLAANLVWAWLANGANDRNDPVNSMNSLLAPVAITPKEPVLKSEIYPGVGVIFRAHQGPDETYMFLRSGNNWSHWPEDQGHMILMSRGATLLPFQPYQYWGVQNKEFEDKNTLRFGHPENKMPHAWPDASVLDHSFGDSVDYAWSYVGFPDWYINPGATPEFGGIVDAPVGKGGLRKLADGIEQKQGAFDWNRQVMFMKGKNADSPNYFVINDSTNGDGKLANWFYLNLLGTKDNVKTTGSNIMVDTEWPVKLDLQFPQMKAIAPDFYEERQPVALAGYSGPSWWSKTAPISPNWVKQDGSPLPANPKDGMWEKHTMLRIAGAPGSGYLWVIYPRKADEPAPVITSLATGVVKIEHPEGIDYTFMSSTPLTYNADGILFEGSAGAVRIGKDGIITLVLTSGHGRIGYKGTIISGVAPFEKTIKVSDIKIGETVIPSATSSIAIVPQLTGHQDVAPGVKKVQKDNSFEYIVDAGKSISNVVASDGNVKIDAGKALIYSDGKSVRFIVPDAVYAKMSIGNVGVRGVGPFDLTFAADKITGKVEGKTRTIATTWPEKITRPMYHMDGDRWFAGWADDHSITKGTATPQFGFAFGVTDGSHTVDVSEWTYPELPTAPAQTMVKF